ncbi:MAG: hypothetical protein KAG56_10920, partial [Sulfurovaceae bacterium]|nr:hypothetical protein [Sulfurovaceae bacterium]
MLTTENIILLIVIAVLLINFQTILTSILIFFQELRDPKIETIAKEEIEQSIYEVIKPYEKLLLSLGFLPQSQIVISNIMVKHNIPQYAFYYY